MPQSLARIYVHLIFSTKNREAVLHDSIRTDLHNYMGGILRDLGVHATEINTESDHAHVVFMLSRTVTLADTVKELKRGSSIWLKEKDRSLPNFHWQHGYAAFSVSETKLEIVRRYVRNQRAHHEKESFQDEYRRWLNEYHVEFDEQFVWD